MKCALCNGNLGTVIGSIQFKSKPLGNIFIPNIKHSVCCNCGDIIIDCEESGKIKRYLEEKETEAILSLPIGDFVSLNEAAQILGVTKQAFSKNPRIKRGMIYSVTKDNRKFYFKKSVEEFKRNGKDGRINISSQVRESHIERFTKELYASRWVSSKTLSIYSVGFWKKVIAKPDVFTNVARKKQTHTPYCNTNTMR